MAAKGKRYILWFEEIGLADRHLVGGKNSSLGELIRELIGQGVNVPGGFAIAAEAYRYLLETAGIEQELKSILTGLDTSDFKGLQRRGRKARNLIRAAQLPADLAEEISRAYQELCQRHGHTVDVAVRSSATAEDLPDASFAGQQQTFLHIQGEEELLEACSDCFASLFTDRAISYREDKGFSHFDVYLSIGVQKMVRSDSACAGVMFSIDTESGFRDVVVISASYGLGETVVQGTVDPDEYYVFKPTLNRGKKPIISKHLGTKNLKMIYASREEKRVRSVKVRKEERERYALTDDEMLQLAKWACQIEEHYSEKAGHYVPMDIEWAKDGDGIEVGTGQLYVVQARPETVHSVRDKRIYETYVLKETGRRIVSGRAIGQKIGRGEAIPITSAEEMDKFKSGGVLVTRMTDPDWEPVMKMAGAIVTDRGGRTCHAAIVSRELGIPCIIGTQDATEKIEAGQKVTVSCCEGLTGYVYDGLLKYEIEKRDIATIPKTKTKIMMNIGIPEKALAYAHIPCSGVGLAREEFIINSYIGVHPLALLNYRELQKKRESDPAIRQIMERIDDRTAAEPDKPKFFVDCLARGIGRIAAAFYPRDVIVRFSDFKSNEYSKLIGGELFEPKESNPMIGWRGAARYYDSRFRAAFALECEALRKVREEMGLENVKVMVPFCRTPDEGTKVIETMRQFGLKQGENGLEVYVMIEVPSNVIVADEFADIFDGFSIGSNDLTQLALGLDRDSELVSHIFSERSEPVKRLVRQLMEVAKEKGKKVGICGQAPSDFPDFAGFLVECGIDSISLNPDTVVETTLTIADKERQLGIEPGGELAERESAAPCPQEPENQLPVK